MCGPNYVQILNNHYLRTLKDFKLRQTGTLGIIFQQDNDLKHWCKVAEAWFQAKHIMHLPWPSSSPDINIIEHVWDQLDTLVHAWNLLPHNKEDLWAALQEKWANFPQAALDTLFKSMPSHMAALLKAWGGNTKY